MSDANYPYTPYASPGGYGAGAPSPNSPGGYHTPPNSPGGYRTPPNSPPGPYLYHPTLGPGGYQTPPNSPPGPYLYHPAAAFANPASIHSVYGSPAPLAAQNAYPSSPLGHPFGSPASALSPSSVAYAPQTHAAAPPALAPATVGHGLHGLVAAGPYSTHAGPSPAARVGPSPAAHVGPSWDAQPEPPLPPPLISIRHDFDPDAEAIHAYMVRHLRQNSSTFLPDHAADKAALADLMDEFIEEKQPRLFDKNAVKGPYPLRSVFMPGRAGRLVEIYDYFGGMAFIVSNLELTDYTTAQNLTAIRSAHIELLAYFTKWVWRISITYFPTVAPPATTGIMWTTSYTQKGTQVSGNLIGAVASTGPAWKEGSSSTGGNSAVSRGLARSKGLAGLNSLLEGLNFNEHGPRYYLGEKVDYGHCCEQRMMAE
ncbi:hypothetical protein MKEN_00238400 [Mycena kentingensis (nom. inval.)]|nr:hypothetical protein MKEN_00238400 [Mycena kentingensis (nom. inval.)]